MKRLLVLSGLFWLSAACSSAPMHHDGYDPKFAVLPVQPEPNVRLLQPGERVPAGEPRLYWTEDHRDVNVGPQGQQVELAMNLNYVHEWEETVMVRDTRWESQLVWEAGMCSDWDCSQTGGGGSSPLWDAFYSAPRNQKAKALAEAIKGVGEPTAAKLIAANVFHSKPRSWEAFKNAIKSAARAGHIGDDIVYQVTVKYADANLVALGYTQSSCRPYSYACQTLVEKLVQVPYMRPDVQLRRTVRETHPRMVQLIVRDPKLQAFEQDRVRVTVGRDPGNVRVQVDGYTRYNQQMSLQGDVARVELVGADRIRVGLPPSAVVRAGYQLRGNAPIFTLAVDPRYIPAPGTNDQLVLKYRVRTCKTILGICGKKTETAEVMQPITGPETNVEIKDVKGLKSVVIFSVARKNSDWYSDEFTAERETDDARQK